MPHASCIFLLPYCSSCPPQSTSLASLAHRSGGTVSLAIKRPPYSLEGTHFLPLELLRTSVFTTASLLLHYVLEHRGERAVCLPVPMTDLIKNPSGPALTLSEPLLSPIIL